MPQALFRQLQLTSFMPEKSQIHVPFVIWDETHSARLAIRNFVPNLIDARDGMSILINNKWIKIEIDDYICKNVDDKIFLIKKKPEIIYQLYASYKITR